MGLRARLWLCLGALTPYVLDVALTLAGQPSSYWQGEYDTAVEANPLARWFLRGGPAVFAGSCVAWGLVVTAMLCLWRSQLVVVATFLIALGHALGAGSWLVRWGWPGWLATVVWLVAVEELLGACWRRAGVRDETLA